MKQNDRLQSARSYLTCAFLLMLCLRGHAATTQGLRLEKEEQLKGAFDERLTSGIWSPGIRTLINEQPDASAKLPLNIVFYALPNGNTIEHTIGKAEAPGLDWHFYIQHIGAQTRRLRELSPENEWVVIYLQAQDRAWPSWRKQHANNAQLVKELIETVRGRFAQRNPTVHLLAHSGGGGVLFSFINAEHQIPDYVQTFCWLDANYAYDSVEKHGEKLLKWLKAGERRRLISAAYDDRYIMLNGKRVVSDTGGTFRATHRMYDDLRAGRELTSSTLDSFIVISDQQQQVDLRIHQNPENKILHTVLVEKNGFLHALAPESVDKLWGEVRYRKWIQD